jgi:ribosome recycling factor
MLQELSASLDKTIEHLKSEFSGISVGRANPGIIEHIQIDCYGVSQPIKSVANISCPDTQTLRVEPWDKNMVGTIEKAIRDANIGINPQNMGDSVFLPVPPMTEERRKQVIKKVKEISEESKVVVRNIRHDILKKIKHQKEEKEISEDEMSRLEKQIQEKVDEGNKTIDELTKKKEQDVMTI